MMLRKVVLIFKYNSISGGKVSSMGYGIITYTIEKSDNWEDISEGLLEIFSLIPDLKLYKSVGTHDTLFVIETNIKPLNLGECIFNYLSNFLEYENKFENISILLSINNKVIEIISKEKNKRTCIIQLLSYTEDGIIKKMEIKI